MKPAVAGAATALAGLLVMAIPAYAALEADAKVSRAAKASRGSKTGSKTMARPKASQTPVASQRFDIDDFAVQGAETLAQIEIEQAIYPYLGPNRSADDVEKARSALEKAYHDKGYQTVSVSVPQQNVSTGVVILKVTELKVGRLRVRNSRYFDLDRVRNGAPSLKEGSVPNFGEVTKDIVSLNQWPDRRVTPALRAGVTPGTVDVDLNVEDKPPLHGSVETNNRQSPNSTPARIIATVHYDNLWQAGHSFSFTYQVAPQRPSDAEVFSASYLARVRDLDWLSFLTYGVKSSSNVATVGGTNVIGPGEIVGERAMITLPTRDHLFHTVSVGLDFKHFDQTVKLGTDGFSSPVTYYPLAASYTAIFQNEKFSSQMTASVTHNLRGPSSPLQDFDNKRFGASPNFSHFNLDVSHTQELPRGFQLYGRAQGQAADGPLVSSEQFSIGGLDTVRGYLESEVLGDNGATGAVELRSPDVGDMLQKIIKNEAGDGPPRFTTFNEWRYFAFTDAGYATVLHPLPEQVSHFNVWSYGLGARFKVFDHINGMATYAVPMVGQSFTRAFNPRLNFRIWGEF